MIIHFHFAIDEAVALKEMILDLALFKVFLAKMALDAAILRSRLSVAS